VADRWPPSGRRRRRSTRCRAPRRRAAARERAPAEALIGDASSRLYSTPSGRLTTRSAAARSSPRPCVAQQRRDEHGLAGAIDAALGVEERVERARRVAAGDAAIGQVERALRQIEKAVVVGERRRPAGRAPAPPVPRDRPGSKSTRPSAPVVLVASTSLLRAISRISTPERRGGGERTRDRVDAVLAGSASGRGRRRPSIASRAIAAVVRRVGVGAASAPSTAAR
jgi:hypothetical protein